MTFVQDFSYLHFAIGFSTLMFVLEIYLQKRQHSHFSQSKRPYEVESIVTEDEFTKSQSYNRDKSTFSFVQLAFDQIETLVVWLYFLLPKLWDYSHQMILRLDYVEATELSQSIMFVIITSFLSDLISLPFSLYSTFVIEERHGFNKQTLYLFFSDLLKSTVLKLLIGLPVLYAILLLIKHTGPMFPVYVWAFLLVFKIILITIFPTVIQPCFNKVEPLEDGTLRTKIEALASKIKFPLKRLYSIDGSKRSSHSNAYLYGFCNNKRIVLFDTLIEQCTEEQIVSVLAHELGHWKMNHTLKGLIFGEIQTILLFGLFQKVMYTRELYESFGFTEMPILIGLILFLVMYSPVSHATTFLTNFMSRRFEFQADGFSKHLGHAEDLKAALIVMQKKNLGNMVPDSWYSTYHYSHPPVVERLQSLSKTE